MLACNATGSDNKMQSWLRNAVYDYYLNSKIEMKTQCTVVHVRKSVIKGHGQRKYHAIKEYIGSMNKLKKQPESIILIRRMYFNRTRFRGNEGGWENHLPSGDPKTEVITLLAESKAAKYCDSMSR